MHHRETQGDRRVEKTAARLTPLDVLGAHRAPATRLCMSFFWSRMATYGLGGSSFSASGTSLKLVCMMPYFSVSDSLHTYPMCSRSTGIFLRPIVYFAVPSPLSFSSTRGRLKHQFNSNELWLPETAAAASINALTELQCITRESFLLFSPLCRRKRTFNYYPLVVLPHMRSWQRSPLSTAEEPRLSKSSRSAFLVASNL